MPPAVSHEKYLLTIGILHLLDHRYDALPRPGRILQLVVTNLRNRPLSSTTIDSMEESILSLYHNLITDSKDFPPIAFKGSFRSCLMASPFLHTEQEVQENTTPQPVMEGLSGMLVLSSSTTRPILTPVLPERTELGALRADRRNCVRRVEVDGRTVTRVISPVYHSESARLTNLWRLSDYRADGQVLMSVLCQFTKESARCAKTWRQKRKRKDTETSGCSSLSPPAKRMRV